MQPTLQGKTMTEAELKVKLDTFMEEIGYVGKEEVTMIGYPIPFVLDEQHQKFVKWYHEVNPIHKHILNNVGNFQDPDSICSSHEYEEYVIKYFAHRLGFQVKENPDITPPKIDTDLYWGFISNSGTDGNNHGLYYGRKYLYDLQHKLDEKAPVLQPVVYVSKEAHYSIQRMVDLQNLEGKIIETDATTGAMDLKNLEEKIDPTKPVLIAATVGTTMRGGIDNVEAIANMLKGMHLQKGYYIHVDAALFGGYLMFTKKEAISKQKLGYHSISISGHKFFGCDDPCGIFVTTHEMLECVKKTTETISYLNANVPTLSCSRSGLAILKLYYKLKISSESDWELSAANCLTLASFLCSALKSNGFECWKVNELSNTVVIKMPGKKLFARYRLAESSYTGYGGKVAHIVVMQHVTKTILEKFVKDLIEDRDGQLNTKKI